MKSPFQLWLVGNRSVTCCFWAGMLFLVSLTAICAVHVGQIAPPKANVALIEGWPWFEDAYFNLKFQYPPQWKVHKIDVTNYVDQSRLNLAGEDAALAGSDGIRTWIIKITPPYEDTQIINRGNIGVTDSSIIVLQPNNCCRGTSLFSAATRTADRQYESVLDPYSEDFVFNIMSHLTLTDTESETFISVGYSRDGTISGITAVKRLPNLYHFQSYTTMTSGGPHEDQTLIAFMEIIGSMALLSPTSEYKEIDYQIPVN